MHSFCLVIKYFEIGRDQSGLLFVVLGTHETRVLERRVAYVVEHEAVRPLHISLRLGHVARGAAVAVEVSVYAHGCLFLFVEQQRDVVRLHARQLELAVDVGDAPSARVVHARRLQMLLLLASRRRTQWLLLRWSIEELIGRGRKRR